MSTPSSQRLKGGARHDIAVNGPALAAHALRADLVDEIHNVHLPRGRRRRKTVLPGSCAVEAGIGRRAPVPQRRGLSAVRCPWLIEVKGAPMNRCSPYLLSILRIIAAFVYMVHGTQKLFFSCTVPDATPSSAVSGRRHYRDFWWLAFVAWTIHSTRRLHSFRRDGCCLLQVPRTTGILAAAERRRRRGALLLHVPLFREHGWRAVEL